MRTNRYLSLGLAVLLGLPLAAAPVRTQEASKDIIAVQIRKQGFACKTALSAERDLEASKPDSEVWTLKCDDAAYRVQLVPRQAAKVERLPDEAERKEQN